MKRLLLVDDERNMLSVLELLFRQHGFQTHTAPSAEAALDILDRSGLEPDQQGFDMIISDLRLPGMDGIQLLQRVNERPGRPPFLLVTAYGTIERAVEVMKLGAVDVLTKPFDKETILRTVERHLQVAPPPDRVSGPLSPRSLTQGAASPTAFDDLVWQSPAMDHVVSLLKRVGPFNLPVLLTGESGTGKDVAARILHRLYSAGRGQGPFVSVNCPAVPESLLESELFGYRKGAFTGANQDFAGKVAMADGGTLFFDEIGDLPPSIQPKLLRLLENRSFEALGSCTTRHVDIRIVCATNRDLRALVRDGTFREDLLYRINTFAVELPPLRKRPEDIPLLAAHFLRQAMERFSRPGLRFGRGVTEALQAFQWPGNIRELKNAIERATVLASSPELGLRDFPPDLAASARRDDSSDKPSSLDSAERSLIAQALDQHGGNISAAARHLGISRNTLRYRMAKHGFSESRS